MLGDLLAQGKFQWGGRWETTRYNLDCLGLALRARAIICPAAPLLPDFSWVYDFYTRETLPPLLVAELLAAHTQSQLVVRPEPGDLALVQGARGTALGTFVGDWEGVEDGVLLWGLDEKPVIEPDYCLANLMGYWHVLPVD
jgi:hypothetical protein